MRFSRLAVTEAESRSAGRYRWVIVWLSIGCVIAFLLLGNAVRDYRFVSRLLATQQVRHQMTEMSVQVEQQLRRNEHPGDVLQGAFAGNTRGAASIRLLDGKGGVVEQLGNGVSLPGFSQEEEHRAFSRREPLFRTVVAPTGDVIVEVFPLHPGRPPIAAPTPPAIMDQRPLALEIAMPLTDADAATLAPIRRNLTINIAAALALLATVLLAGVGLRSYVRGRRLEEQMEIARQVQSRLLPSATLQLPGVQIATEYKPSEQVSGDFYDAFSSEREEVAVVIGDVSGKGIPAALLMGVIHGAVRTAQWRSTAAAHEEESERLNRLLCEHASGHRFASMFWCVYEAPLSALRYVNAGHCPPFLLSKRDGKLLMSRLERGGPVLGLLPDAHYEAATVQVSSGDLLVMYSDGLVEATDAKGEEYGDERLSVLLHGHAEETPGQLRETLIRSLALFPSTSATQDDLTFAIIRF